MSTDAPTCDLAHDPTPWLSYTMSTGQHGWRGRDKFKPREGYCQEFKCYEKGRHE